MTLRLCVVGNSHIAALKLAWDQASTNQRSFLDGLRPTFFGAPSDGMRHVCLENGVILPRRKFIAEYFRKMSGGSDQIQLADYDAFLLVGLNVSMKRTLRFYKTHAWLGLSGIEGKVLVHPAFAHEFLSERYADTRMVDLAAKIRSAVDKPILAVAEPHWAASVRRAEHGPNYGWDEAIAAGDGAALGKAFERAVDEALAPHGRFLPQPDATLDNYILTRAEFNQGASRLISGEGEETDASHMNAAYGLALWSAITHSLAA